MHNGEAVKRNVNLYSAAKHQDRQGETTQDRRCVDVGLEIAQARRKQKVQKTARIEKDSKISRNGGDERVRILLPRRPFLIRRTC